MPLRKQSAKPAQMAIGLALQHGISVHAISGQRSRAEYAVVAGVDQATPEVEIFPAPWDVVESTHLLPSTSTDQSHRVNMVSLPCEMLALPTQTVYKVVVEGGLV